MRYSFNAYGHPSVLGTHKNTIEFTKDKEISLKGDCIIGVNADFDLSDIRNLINKSAHYKVSITIEALGSKKIKETIIAEINPDFRSYHEIVIRKTDFVSGRTLATKADKACNDLNKELISFLKEKKNKIRVVLGTSSKKSLDI